jgi:hypothetical protein
VEDKVPVSAAGFEEKYAVTDDDLPAVPEEKYSVSAKEEEEKVPVIAEALAAALEAATADFLLPEVIKVELDLEEFTSTYER